MDKEGEINMPIVVEKARVNVWNIVGFATGMAVSAFGWGMTYASMTYADAKNAEQIENVKSDISDLKSFSALVTQSQYNISSLTSSVSENKKAIEEANRRVDRVVESFSSKLDTIVDKVNVISTNVEVLKNSRVPERRASVENGRYANANSTN